MIVLDEAHVILCSREFRQVMKDMHLLIACKVPLTLLTATLPPRLEQSLVKECRLPTHKIIRAPSDRKEHQYSIVRVDRDDVVKKTLGVVDSLTGSLQNTGRGIIFVRSKAIGKELQSCLPGVDLITGGITDDQAREQMMQKWKTGLSGGWIIGTSCLIQGVDYPDVHLVVFAGSPWGLIDFVQGAGRGGRSGAMCRIVLVDGGEAQRSSDTEDALCSNEMVKWTKNSDKCRRLGISQCMDKGEVTCRSLEGAIHCDVCTPDPAMRSILKTTVPLHGASAWLPPVSLAAPTGFLTEPSSQLPIPDLRPQPARSVAVKASKEAHVLASSRKERAFECILTLRAFGNNCGACHVQEMLFTGDPHPMCINRFSGELKTFYQWNKPKVKGKEV